MPHVTLLQCNGTLNSFLRNSGLLLEQPLVNMRGVLFSVGGAAYIVSCKLCGL